MLMNLLALLCFFQMGIVDDPRCVPPTAGDSETYVTIYLPVVQISQMERK